MPIYEYICTKCNERFALLQSIRNCSDGSSCPKCSSKEVKKVMSSFCCSSDTGSSAAPSAPRGFSGGG